MKIKPADKWFSRYIRLRGAWESNGILVNKCATSGKIVACKDLECGHYQSRRHTSVRWNEHNAAPQTTYENHRKYGNPEAMALYLDETFGEGTADRMKIMTRSVYRADEKTISDHFRNKVNEIVKAKNWKNYIWW